jgi:hypothetical protein
MNNCKNISEDYYFMMAFQEVDVTTISLLYFYYVFGINNITDLFVDFTSEETNVFYLV